MVQVRYDSFADTVIQLEVWEVPPIDLWTAYQDGEDDFIENEYEKLNMPMTDVT